METFCYDFKWILKVGERQIQKKICHTTEWPLIAKKGTVCPPPFFVSNSACLLFYSRQMNQ